MGFSREDVAPVLAILVSATLAVGVTLSGVSRSGGDHELIELRMEHVSDGWRAAPSSVEARGVHRVEGLIRAVETLYEEQRSITARVGQLSHSPSDRSEVSILELREAKDRMLDVLHEIDEGLALPRSAGTTGSLAREGRAVGQVLVDKVRYSRGTLAQWDTDSAVMLEQDIQRDLVTMLAVLVRIDGSRGR